MEAQVSLSAARIGFTVAAVAFDVLFPLVVALLVRRRLGAPWRFFFFGALIFAAFQLLTRVPAVLALQTLVAPQLQASQPLLYAWLIALSFSAGLFEEVGRYVGYRWLFKPAQRSWRNAVMYGVGHGGIESALLVGGLVALGLVNLIVLSRLDVGALPLTPEQRAQLDAQLAAVAAQPDWLALIGAWERLWALPFHVGLSVIVLQVFRRAQIGWLWLAVVLHGLVNLLATAAPVALGLSGLPALLVPEVVITLAGAAALWLVWRMREPDPAPEGEVPAVVEPPGAVG